jgi:spore germination protein GerM
MRPLVFALIVALVSGACSIDLPRTPTSAVDDATRRPTGVASPAPTFRATTPGPNPSPVSGGTPAATPSGAVVAVYFPRMDSQGHVTLVRVERQVASAPTPEVAVAQFVAGPSGEERARDVEIALRRSTTIRSARLNDHTAAVDFGPEIHDLAGRPWVEAVYWSLALTLLDLPGVQHVELRADGRPLRTLGSPPFAIPEAPRREQVPFPVEAWPGGAG